MTLCRISENSSLFRNSSFFWIDAYIARIDAYTARIDAYVARIDAYTTCESFQSFVQILQFFGAKILAPIFFCKKMKKIRKCKFLQKILQKILAKFLRRRRIFCAYLLYYIYDIYTTWTTTFPSSRGTPSLGREARSPDFGRALKRGNDTTTHFLGLVLGCIDAKFCK